MAVDTVLILIYCCWKPAIEFSTRMVVESDLVILRRDVDFFFLKNGLASVLSGTDYLKLLRRDRILPSLFI